MKKKLKILLASCFFLSTSAAYSQMLVWGDMNIGAGGSVRADKQIFVDTTGTITNNGVIRAEEQISIAAGETNAGLITNSATLIASGGISFQSQPKVDGMLHNSGTVTYQDTSSNVSLKKSGLVKGIWYYLSVPFRVKVQDIVDKNPGIRKVYVRKYDGQARANSNKIDGSNWGADLGSEDYLEPLIGYAFAYSNLSSLTEVIFPADVSFNPNNSTNGIHISQKDVTVEYYESYATDAAGWNCLGSPYTSNYTLNQTSTGLNKGFAYVAKATGTNIYYDSKDLSSQETSIPPFSMVFFKLVESTQNNVRFHQNHSTTTASVFRSEAISENKKIMIQLDDNKVRKEIGYPDECTLVMGENYQEGYSSEDDGPKMLAPSKEVSEVWLEMKNSSLFVSKIPTTNSYREVNLGFNAGDASADYTIQASGNNLDDTSITLLDKKTGEQVNILNEKYSFSSTAGVDKSRFVLIFGSKSPTGLDNPDASQVQIYSENGTIHVNNLVAGDKIYVYDTVGKLLKAEVSTGNNASIQLNNKGICIVKVTGSSQAVHKVYNN